MHGKELNTKGAVWKTIRMASSRVKAHGAKWRKWFNSHAPMEGDEKEDVPPHRYQENILIEFDDDARYWISRRLRTTFQKVRDDMYGVNT